jgi:hypothetical protein
MGRSVKLRCLESSARSHESGPLSDRFTHREPFGTHGRVRPAESHMPLWSGQLQRKDDQLPHAPGVTVTSTVVADRPLVTTSRVAPTADVTLPPVTLVQ